MTDAARGASDERPRPQYGEYATPEEQQARIRQPDATDALLAGQALDAPANPTAAPAQQAPPATRTGSALARPVTGWRLADRIVTFGLLGYGLFNVIATAVQLFSFEQFANTMLGLLGIDTAFSNVSEGQLWGALAGITVIVGWALTAYLTFRRLRRGKISFWIPLAGFLVVQTAVVVMISIPLVNDPAFSELFSRV